MITPLIKTRFNLAAKLNFLTILLILVTSAGISIFVFRTESTSYYQELLSHGRTIADMTSKNCEYGIYTEDRLSLLPVIESLSVDPAIAYVSVMNRQDRSLVSKVFKQSLEMPALPFSDDIHGARGIGPQPARADAPGESRRAHRAIVAPLCPLLREPAGRPEV